ncbi:TPA: DotA/TraY family protein, partial [Escherichia coli]
LTAQRSAMDTMLRDLDSAAQEFVSAYRTRRDTGNGNLPDIESRIQKAANRYEETVQKALPTDNAETERREQLKSYLTTYGWVALGAWYQTFATANQRLEDLANRAPTVSGVSSLGEAGDTEFLKEVKGAYQAQLQNSTYTPALGTLKSANEYNSAGSNDPQSAILSSIPGVELTNNVATIFTKTGTTTDQLNPLIKMKNIGDYTMGITESIWAGYTTVRVLSTAGSNSIFGRLVNTVTGLPEAAKAFMEAAAPPLYFLLFLLFCAGFSLSIYLPFIPFIFWMTGIGNWIVSVLIGCAAGPLWAATHLGTSQDRGSRAAYGYIYLIDSMIRPLLMVFGFFFASVAIIAAGTILNSLFGAALVNVQTDSLTGLFSMAGFLLIYARVCTTLVAAVFALQAYLPDHVINFLGGRDGVNMLGNMVSSVKDIIAGGNTNMRRTPSVREEKLKNINRDDKDGIKQ